MVYSQMNMVVLQNSFEEKLLIGHGKLLLLAKDLATVVSGHSEL